MVWGPGPSPNRKQKQRAAGAKLWSNHFKTGGYPCILAAQATAQSPPYPIWTDPTNPARRPSDRPIAAIDTPRAPTLGPLGTRPDKTQGMGPPGPPAFSCFRFFPPSLSLGCAGPPTTREFKNAPPSILGARARAGVHFSHTKLTHKRSSPHPDALPSSCELTPCPRAARSHPAPAGACARRAAARRTPCRRT